MAASFSPIVVVNLVQCLISDVVSPIKLCVAPHRLLICVLRLVHLEGSAPPNVVLVLDKTAIVVYEIVEKVIIFSVILDQKPFVALKIRRKLGIKNCASIFFVFLSNEIRIDL